METRQMQLISGKDTASQIKEELKQEVAQWTASGNRAPHLAAVLVGNDGASETYVGHKVKACEQVGFRSSMLRFDEQTSEEQLLATVAELNADDSIDGFIVQLPLPPQINADRILQAIDPKKDVDGFHPENVGRMSLGLPAYIPATPLGIVTLLERYRIPTEGKHCVVVGRSNIVGRPMSILMSRSASPGNCTVTLCHSRTVDLKKHCLSADILIVALGKPGFITGDMIREAAVVIDVGTTRVSAKDTKSGYRLKGDVLFDEASEKASWITPVPGGVGPMTVCSLLLNTMRAAKKEVYG